MSKSTNEIYEFIESYCTKDREKNVIKAIEKYMANNHDSILDGIIEKPIKFGNVNRDRIIDPYNITEKEWKKFTSTHRIFKSTDMKVAGDLMRQCLLHSYYKTNNRLYLDFMAITIFGSRYSQVFPKGVKPHVMKYTIENVTTARSLFKKHGSAFGVIEETVSTMLESKPSTSIGKALKNHNDESTIEVLNSLYTRINSTIKTVQKHYYETDAKEKSGYILNVSDEADDGKLSLSNNSVRVTNLMTLIENYNSNVLDELILKTIRVNEPVKRAIMSELLISKGKYYFIDYAKIFIDYYIKSYGSDWNKMKSQFITKANGARMNSKELKTIDDTLVKDVKTFLKEYKKISDEDNGDLKTAGGILKMVRLVKDYVIIKIRHMMNDI